MDYLWTNLYRRANDANEICRLAEQLANDSAPNKSNDALAIGLTLRAWLMFNLTEMFGPVPYSDAFKGGTESNFRPIYDKQEDIYPALLADLKRANTLYSSTNFTDAVDKLYEGNVLKWRKFTNSLRVRYLMRVSHKVEVGAAAELSAMLSDAANYPLFNSVADGAILYFAEEPFYNKFYDVKATEFSGIKKMCKTLVDYMNTTNDPRRALYMTLYNKSYVGIPSGVDQATIDIWMNKTSTLSSGWQAINCPFGIMTYSELQFLLAEASQKGFIGGGEAAAGKYYNAGIKAAIQERNINSKTVITDEEINQFLAQPKVAYNHTLSQIMEQKWVALFFCGFESWTEFRRTGLPSFIKPGPAAKQSIVPTRFYYPEICKSTNKVNYDIGVSYLGGQNDMTSKLWFAQ